MVDGIDLEICLSIDYNLKDKVKKSKNILDAFMIKKTSECDEVMTHVNMKPYQNNYGQ